GETTSQGPRAAAGAGGAERRTLQRWSHPRKCKTQAAPSGRSATFSGERFAEKKASLSRRAQGSVSPGSALSRSPGASLRISSVSKRWRVSRGQAAPRDSKPERDAERKVGIPDPKGQRSRLRKMVTATELDDRKRPCDRGPVHLVM